MYTVCPMCINQCAIYGDGKSPTPPPCVDLCLCMCVMYPSSHLPHYSSHTHTHTHTPPLVFDDGDERTLKRSSLCLKGGRHFDKSESLDNLPLTDPENFGTPVLHSTKKPSRKRRRCSQSPSRKEDGVSGKRPCSYPDEFPVGKVRGG